MGSYIPINLANIPNRRSGPPKSLACLPCVTGFRKGQGHITAVGAGAGPGSRSACESAWGRAGAGALAASQISVGPPRYRQGMRYLMLMWADADSTIVDRFARVPDA